MLKERDLGSLLEGEKGRSRTPSDRKKKKGEGRVIYKGKGVPLTPAVKRFHRAVPTGGRELSSMGGSPDPNTPAIDQ